MDISFITVCYNGLYDTCELIDSILKIIKSVSYEIIVVDNASFQNEAEIIHSRYPFTKTIRSEKNLGFAAGNNLGIKLAKGKYLFFINNDTFIEIDTLRELIGRLESNPKIGGVSPKIRFALEPKNIQYAGFTPLKNITLRNESIGFNNPDNGLYNSPCPTPYLHGAAMVVKHEAIKRVGPMPELYFLYYEELDWSISFYQAGYELWYDPIFTVYHKESRSTGQKSPLQAYYITRNRLLFAQRNLHGIVKLLSIIYQIVIVCPKNIIKALINQKGSIAKATIKGVYAFLTKKN